MELSNFLEKTVEIVDVFDNIFTGYVDEYFYPEDNENGKESITIQTQRGEYIEFYEQDIKSIKIIN